MAVHYTEELLTRAQAWVSKRTIDKRSESGMAELSQLYADLTNTEPGSCSHCQFNDYNAAVTNYIRQAQRFLYPETVANATYTLAPGFEAQTLVHDRHPKAVNSENLTDKDAEFFIANGYAHAFLKNGKPLPKEDEKEETSDAPKRTEKQQAQDDYRALFEAEPKDSMTTKQLKAAIAQKEAELESQDSDSTTDTGATDATGDSTSPSAVDAK